MLLEPKIRVSPARLELANDAGRDESAPVLRRCQADLTPKMLPHHHARVKTDLCRDLLDTKIGLFQQAASGQNPLLGEPLCGVVPTSAANRRAKVRWLIVARLAREDAVCCSERFDRTQLSSGARLPASRVGPASRQTAVGHHHGST
jgi:hypothetical protein